METKPRHPFRRVWIDKLLPQRRNPSDVQRRQYPFKHPLRSRLHVFRVPFISFTSLTDVINASKFAWSLGSVSLPTSGREVSLWWTLKLSISARRRWRSNRLSRSVKEVKISSGIGSPARRIHHYYYYSRLSRYSSPSRQHPPFLLFVSFRENLQ